MSIRTPIVRPISWIAVVPQIFLIGLAIGIGYFFFNRDGIVFGGVCFLAYSLTTRYLLTREHRAGIRLAKQQRFEDAIPRFRKSLAFFDRHPWVDQFRAIVMMSASALCYREMALANIGFCYSQIGDGEQARQFYEKCLERFPDCGLAVSALRMMDSGAQPHREH